MRFRAESSISSACDDDTDIEIKQRKPKPPPPDEPPPDMPKPDFDNSDVSQGVDIGAVDVNVDLNVGGIGGFSSDGEYLPIVKVAPGLSRRAQTRGIEGYVLLEFIVTKTGAVDQIRWSSSQATGHLRQRSDQRGAEIQVQAQGGQR